MKTQAQFFSDLIINKDPARLQSLWEDADVLRWQETQKPILAAQDVINILLRHLDGNLTKEQVEDWANLMEAADIALGGIGSEIITDAINDLANPVLEGELTRQSAEKLIRTLQKDLGK